MVTLQCCLQLQEWASTLRPAISCGAPGASYNAYADFDVAHAQQQTPPAQGGGRHPPRANGQRSALSPQLKAMSSPECAAAMTAAAAAVAGGQRHPQHPHHMVRMPTASQGVRVNEQSNISLYAGSRLFGCSCCRPAVMCLRPQTILQSLQAWKHARGRVPCLGLQTVHMTCWK